MCCPICTSTLNRRYATGVASTRSLRASRPRWQACDCRAGRVQPATSAAALDTRGAATSGLLDGDRHGVAGDAVLGDHQRNSGASFHAPRHHNVHLVESNQERRQPCKADRGVHPADRRGDRGGHRLRCACLTCFHRRTGGPQAGAENRNKLAAFHGRVSRPGMLPTSACKTPEASAEGSAVSVVAELRPALLVPDCGEAVSQDGSPESIQGREGSSTGVSFSSSARQIGFRWALPNIYRSPPYLSIFTASRKPPAVFNMSSSVWAAETVPPG